MENLIIVFEKEIQKLIKELMPYKPQKIILFGSTARGDLNEGSDLDIVIIKDTKKRFLDRIADVLSFYQGKKGLDVLVYTPDEFEKMKEEGNPFIRQVLSEGKVIYEQQ